MEFFNDETAVWYKWLDKRVCVKGALFGTLKYFGCTKFSDGLWCGIELDEPVGKNNGIVNNVEYFACLPKYGIFVPVSKVSRIESGSKNSNDTFKLLNETVEVQNSQVDTIQISTSNGQPSNKVNDVIGEILEHKTISNGQDSEESLGLLDPNLIESLDSFSLDIAVNIVPDSQDTLLKLDKQVIGFVDHDLPVSDILFSEEISYPKYASTPRHPVKKRFTEFSCTEKLGYDVQNADKHKEFESEMDSDQDVIFDIDKFKSNPDLASTSELFKIPDASSNKNVNVLSPVLTSEFDNLNKTQILPIPFLNNHDIIIPVSVDLNKTQTVQSGCQAIDSNVLSTTFKMPVDTEANDTGDLNLTVSLQTSDGSENLPKSCGLNTLLDVSTFGSGMSVNPQHLTLRKVQTNFDGSLEHDLNKLDTGNICLSKTLTDNSSSPLMTDMEKNESLLQKTYVLDSSTSNENDNVAQFEQLSFNRKVLEETVILEKSLSEADIRSSGSIPIKGSFSSIDLNSTFKSQNKVPNNASITSKNQKNSSMHLSLKGNNFDKKTAEFKKPIAVYSSFRKSKAPLVKSAKKNSSLIENISVNSSKPIVSDIPPKSGLNSSSDKQLKQKKDLRPYSTENKSAIATKSVVSNRRFSYSQNLESVKSSTTDNLPMPKKHDKNLKIPSKINSSASFSSLSTNDSNLPGKVPLSNIEVLVSDKKIINQISNNHTKNPEGTFGAESFDVEPQINSISSGNFKLEQEKENERFHLIESKSIPSRKPLISRSRFSYSQNTDTVCSSKPPISSRRLSYSQSGAIAVRSNSTSGLPSKVNGNSNIVNRINSSMSKAVPTNDLNACNTSKVSLNSKKNTVSGQKTNKTFNSIVYQQPLSQFKEPATKNKLPVSRQSLGFSSKEYGIPKSNGLSTKSRSNLPVNSRLSMLPSVKERGSCKDIGQTEQPVKSDNLIPETVPIVSSCSTVASLSKTSRIASSLPQKSQISTRKMGLKYNEVKEDCGACPKIPRYNLRGKK